MCWCVHICVHTCVLVSVERSSSLCVLLHVYVCKGVCVCVLWSGGKDAPVYVFACLYLYVCVLVPADGGSLRVFVCFDFSRQKPLCICYCVYATVYMCVLWFQQIQGRNTSYCTLSCHSRSVCSIPL